MGIVQSLLRKDRRESRPGPADPAPKAGPVASPPFVLLVPDAQGIATYHMHTFQTVRSAELYVDVTLRGRVPDRAVTFWALGTQPEPEYSSEPLVIIRDISLPVVYLFSFANRDACLDFIRHEMTRGLELQQVMLYWAVPAAVEMDFWGRAAISPQAPLPASKLPAETGITEKPAVPTPVLPFVARQEPNTEPCYLTEADIADTVREMHEFSSRFDAERADVIDFPVASDSLRRHKEQHRAVVAWDNFSRAVDEALDVHVAQQVRVRLAINRILRALAQAAFIQQGMPGTQTREASSQSQVHNRLSWYYICVALADAAAVAIRRSLMRKVWMNAAWTLEEAAYTHRLETNARARRAWSTLSSAFAEACRAQEAREASRRHAWAMLSSEMRVAAEKQLAVQRACRAWSNAARAFGDAYRTHSRRSKKAAIAWTRMARAFKQALAEHEKRQKAAERARIAEAKAEARRTIAAQKAAERAAAAAVRSEARAAEAAAKAAERARRKAEEAQRVAAAAATRSAEPVEELSEAEQIGRWLEKQSLTTEGEKPRWEPREEPFQGFRSPPGRF